MTGVGQTGAVLDQARRELGLTVRELWWRYFALGGTTVVMEIEAVLCGVLVPSTEDSDILAIALNERFSELGGGYPIPYSTDDQDE